MKKYPTAYNVHILCILLSIAPFNLCSGHDTGLHRDSSSIPEGVLVGTGDFVFKTVPDWGSRDEKTRGSTHGGIVEDIEGNIYVSYAKGIFIFKPDGSLIRGLTQRHCQNLHSMVMVTEEGFEYIYGASVRATGSMLVKIDLEGNLLLKIDEHPIDLAEGLRFKPTAVAVTPQGEILLADGYGSNHIYRYDKSGRYLSYFGGAGDEKHLFNTPHGITLDERYNPPRLLIADRMRRRLAHFDLAGNYIADVATGLRLPCAVSILGDHVAVAELRGRVIILNREHEIVAILGDNPNKEQWAKFNTGKDQWKDGIFIAPHSVSWDKQGNLYVQDWNRYGRVTKLERLSKD